MLHAILNDNENDSQSAKNGELVSLLEAMIAKKEEQIAELEQSVNRYEKRRLKEEQSYQAMSGFRRMLTGRKPDHHLAVEYIHYVKKPMEQVRQLREEIEALRAQMEQNASK